MTNSSSCRVQQGFTLMELIVALTILSMIMVAMYSTFSNYLRLTRKENPRFDRQVEVFNASRILADDYMSWRPFTVRREGATIPLNYVGKDAILYCTLNPYGADAYKAGHIYFAVVYMVDGDNGRELRMYKTLYPAKWFVDLANSFRTSTRVSVSEIESALPGEPMVVVEGLEELAFVSGTKKMLEGDFDEYLDDITPDSRPQKNDDFLILYLKDSCCPASMIPLYYDKTLFEEDAPETKTPTKKETRNG